MYAPRVVATCRYTWLLVLLYSGFRMSEQAAHAAGPPGPAALPQSLRSSSLGQSPQPKPRTASFSDDGCVSPISISNSVAASMSETSPAGRHPISDGGALYQQLPEPPQPIGHFISPTSSPPSSPAPVPNPAAPSPCGSVSRHHVSNYLSPDHKVRVAYYKL